MSDEAGERRDQDRPGDLAGRDVVPEADELDELDDAALDELGELGDGDGDGDGDDEPVGPSERKRPRGTFLGAAMLGLEQAMFGKVKEDTVIQVEASGDPPNIDLDGLDAPFGGDARLVGPPLDQIKSRARRRRRTR